MQNKGAIVFLTVIITALCLYYLSFTFISNGIQEKATTYATDATGNIDFAKKRAYLDSVWRQPVYNFLGASYTYQEVKETELGLGLDLQGGMHVTLEVSPVEIVKGIAGNPKNELFNAAVAEAKEASKTSDAKFADLFYAAWQKNNPGKTLGSVFATAANRGKISLESTDAEILDIIDTEVENAIDRSFNILRTRIDRFGTSQPNIQRIAGSGRIQIELPGADNQERVRNLLQGVAKLQFWEVLELNEYGGSIEEVNQAWVADQKNKAGDLATSDSTATDSTATDSLSVEDSLRNVLEKQLEQIDPMNNANAGISPLIALRKVDYGLIYDVRDTVIVNRILKNERYQSFLPKDLRLLWGVKPTKAEDGTEILELYAIKLRKGSDQAPLEGDVVTDARQTLDQTSQPAVSMQMNADGARKWRNLTAENVGRRIAVVLDDYV